MGLQVATHSRTRYSQLFSLLSCRDEGKEAKETNTKGKNNNTTKVIPGVFLNFISNKRRRQERKLPEASNLYSLRVGCRKCTDMRERNNNHNVTSKLFPR
jgi:hypothetical protein